MNFALLLIRLGIGLGMAAHGAQKLFGWFGGGGIEGTGVFFESIGFRPGKRFALLAGLAEFLGGLLVALGFLGPVGPGLIVAVLLAAILTVHRGNGFFAINNGPELPILYIAGSLLVAIGGPGCYSLDYALVLDLFLPQAFIWSILA